MSKKKFTFPKNVDTSYAIVAGLDGKDIIRYILPATALSVLIALIPPINSFWFWLVKIFVFIIFISIAFVFALVRPVKDRNNIRLIDYLKNYKDFYKRQKVFYMKKRKED